MAQKKKSSFKPQKTKTQISDPIVAKLAADAAAIKGYGDALAQLTQKQAEKFLAAIKKESGAVNSVLTEAFQSANTELQDAIRYYQYEIHQIYQLSIKESTELGSINTDKVNTEYLPLLDDIKTAINNNNIFENYLPVKDALLSLATKVELELKKRSEFKNRLKDSAKGLFGSDVVMGVLAGAATKSPMLALMLYAYKKNKQKNNTADRETLATKKAEIAGRYQSKTKNTNTANNNTNTSTTVTAPNTATLDASSSPGTFKDIVDPSGGMAIPPDAVIPSSTGDTEQLNNSGIVKILLQHTQLLEKIYGVNADTLAFQKTVHQEQLTAAEEAEDESGPSAGTSGLGGLEKVKDKKDEKKDGGLLSSLLEFYVGSKFLKAGGDVIAKAAPRLTAAVTAAAAIVAVPMLLDEVVKAVSPDSRKHFNLPSSEGSPDSDAGNTFREGLTTGVVAGQQVTQALKNQANTPTATPTGQSSGQSVRNAYADARRKGYPGSREDFRSLNSVKPTASNARNFSNTTKSLARTGLKMKGANIIASIAGTGLDFVDRKGAGQTNTQAGVGAVATTGGGILGGILAGAATGAAIAGVPSAGFLAIPGAVIGGIIGGLGGSYIGGAAADYLTGVGEKDESSPDSNSPDTNNLTLKKGDVAGGGPVKPGVLPFASKIQTQVPGFKEFTALNDDFHQGLNSKHNAGLAIDFTLNTGKAGAPLAKAAVENIAKNAGIEGVYVQDEYNYPSRNSTGDHIHVQFNNAASLAAFDRAARDERGASLDNNSQTESPSPMAPQSGRLTPFTWKPTPRPAPASGGAAPMSTDQSGAGRSEITTGLGAPTAGGGGGESAPPIIQFITNQVVSPNGGAPKPQLVLAAIDREPTIRRLLDGALT